MNLFTFVFWLLMFYLCVAIYNYCNLMGKIEIGKIENHKPFIFNSIFTDIFQFCIYGIGALLLFINL